MAVPSSGELKLWDDLWNSELDGSKGNNSLHSASVYAGFSTPDALGDFYGWSDVEVPSVVSLTATSVNYNTAILRGQVTATGNENVTSGFYFGTANSSTSNPKLSLGGTRGTGIYCCSKTSLSAQTSYKSWAFACNSAGECIANTCCTFTTPAPPFSPTQTNWYKSSQADVGQNGAGQDHGVQAFTLNPYSTSFVQLWAVSPTTSANFFTNDTCNAAENTCNKFCHTGNFSSYWQVSVTAKVKAARPSALWVTIFTGRGNPGLPSPGTCKAYTLTGNVYRSDDNNTIEIGGSQNCPSPPWSGGFSGYLCFPSAF